MAAKKGKGKVKELFKKEMKCYRVEEKDTRKADADEDHWEKASFTNDFGDKATLKMTSLPPGVSEGQKLTLIFTNEQTKLEDHED